MSDNPKVLRLLWFCIGTSLVRGQNSDVEWLALACVFANLATTLALFLDLFLPPYWLVRRPTGKR